MRWVRCRLRMGRCLSFRRILNFLICAMKETIVAQRKVAREGLKALKLAEILDNIMNIIVRAKILNINEHRGTKTVKSWPWGV